MPPRKFPPKCGTRQLVAKTCSVCGELKMAEYYPKGNSGAGRRAARPAIRPHASPSPGAPTVSL